MLPPKRKKRPMSIYSTCCRKPSRSSGIIVVLPGAIYAERVEDQQSKRPRARERMARRVGTQSLTERVENPPVGPPILRASIGLPTSHVPPIAAISPKNDASAHHFPESWTVCRILPLGQPRSAIRVRQKGVPLLLSCFPFETAEIK